MDFTQEQLNTLQQKLPPEIVEAIKEYEFGFIVEEIGGKHNLLLNQTDEMYKLVLATIIGESNPAVFQEKLTKALSEEEPTVVADIIKDIDEKIFQKLKEHLVKVFEKKAPHDGEVGPQHRDAILAEIEDPHLFPVVQPIVKPIEENKTNILEQKLGNTVQTTAKNITVEVQPAAPVSKLPPPPPKPYNNDPYREPIV